MDAELKLFVWTDKRRVKIPGLAFALAHDENEARKLITKRTGYEVERWPVPEILDLIKPVAFHVPGE